jgi:hypothetical protein
MELFLCLFFCVKGLFKKKPQIRVLEKRLVYKCVKMFATELLPTFCKFETISSEKNPKTVSWRIVIKI